MFVFSVSFILVYFTSIIELKKKFIKELALPMTKGEHDRLTLATVEVVNGIFLRLQSQFSIEKIISIIIIARAMDSIKLILTRCSARTNLLCKTINLAESFFFFFFCSTDYKY